MAVANVENPGVTVDENGNVSAKAPLSDLLSKADTWNQFLAISACAPTTTDQLFNGISQTYPTIPMSGIYSSSPDVNTHPAKWEDACYEPVFIPADNSGKYTLPGVIHLRRLISQINFNLKPGPDVTITPQSFTVVNAPNYSWLYERKSGIAGVAANPGDYCTEGKQADFYTTSELFANNYIYPAADGSYTFNFWQGENKHTALADADCDTYDKRERESKQAVEGTTPGSSSSLENTGIFISLSGNSWTPNNMASYVIVRCDVKLKNPVTLDGHNYTREGNGVYIIHLGYCEGNTPAEKSADFNCRRNIDYTYNVTITDVNNIYVEANLGTENQPGAEGLVSDVENETIMLDCHYGAFNVQLSDQELGFTPSDYTFGYIVQAFFRGVQYTFDENTVIPDNQRGLVRWIELRPTTDENTLADYKPLATEKGGDGRTFTLDMVKPGALSADCRSATGWYTVFVNEYTYESDSDESSGNDNWRYYVNQDSRRAYIRVMHGISVDGQSTYAKSKYGVSQRSIQTYYSLENYTAAEGDIPARTAIGVEHTNEMRGLNMRSSYAPTNVLDDANGRYNVWAWLNGTRSGGTAPRTGAASKKWSDVVQINTLQSIPSVDEIQYYTQAAATQKLPALAQYGGNLNLSAQDPQPGSYNRSDYIEAINACMNRNRDLNGNGSIEPEELRWYVPALGKYLRMILGRNSLQSPLMDYANIQRINTIGGDNGYATRLVSYASNNTVLWAMEGLSSSAWDGGSGSLPTYVKGGPWEVRCIRNLGSNMASVTKGEKVSAAYTHDAATRTVTMSYYDLNSIRTEKLEYLPVHNIANQNYNRCYYSFEYQSANLGGTYTGNDLLYNNYNPCSSLNTDGETGWRVPNQKELTIMRNLGVLNTVNSNNPYLSCSVSYYTTSGYGMLTDPNLNSRKFMAVINYNDNNGNLVSNATQTEASTAGTIRCVRDK